MDNFGTELKKALDSNSMTAKDLADLLGVSPSMVSKYINNDGFPRPGKWGIIKQRLGLDPQQYVAYSTTQSVADSHLKATNGGTISIAIGGQSEQGDGVQMTLTKLEAEVLNLFRRYGNMAMLERCLSQLRKQQEVFG